MALHLRYAVRSDLGLVRNNNEDSVYAGPRLLAIADGMGGHAAGEVASKIVISTLEHLDEDRRIDDLMAELRDTVLEANRRIAAAVEQKSELEGMGTTLTALRFVGSQVGLAHVGDSRAYLLRGGVLSQITHDDTYVQYLVDTGKLTPDEAKDHPRKSVILRALLGTEVEPDVVIREALAGDRYLLCSDGLSDVVTIETIAEAMQIEDVQEAADRLVELALRGGGPDNVTVIVSDVVEGRAGDAFDDVPVMDGAFVDPAAADIPGDGADSAAERAARMARSAAPATPPPPAETQEPPRRRRRWRLWIVLAVVVVLVIGALGALYSWTQSQYFVGAQDDHVAIFQGVDAEFGPVKLYSLVGVERSLPLESLCSGDLASVKEGIDVGSRGEAQQTVRRLQENRSESCPRTPRDPCPSTSVSPSESGSVGDVAPTSSTAPTSTTTPTTTPTPGASTQSLLPGFPVTAGASASSDSARGCG